jgi:hypothetical protein
MRSVEDIKADIASCEACEKHKSICDRKCPICEHIHDSNKDMFENELLCALTSDIPLDRLEEICKADKEDRILILPKCPKCGLVNAWGYCKKYCDRCGALLYEQAEAALKESEESEI